MLPAPSLASFTNGHSEDNIVRCAIRVVTHLLMMPIVFYLIQYLDGDITTKGPFEVAVQFSSHLVNKYRDVYSLCTPEAVSIYTEAHSVSMEMGVE